jgi:hypothetical protein
VQTLSAALKKAKPILHPHPLCRASQQLGVEDKAKAVPQLGGQAMQQQIMQQPMPLQPVQPMLSPSPPPPLLLGFDPRTAALL